MFLGLCAATLATAAACGGRSDSDGPLRVGVTPVPAGEVMAEVVPLLAQEGIAVDLVSFTDYLQPNLALAAGDLDANLYQNVPFLEQFNRDRGTTLAAVQAVYWPPMGIYSTRHRALSDLPSGATVALPNDPTNLGRGLLLLQSAGLLTVGATAGAAATLADVTTNPRGLALHELEAAQLPRALPDVDAAVVNANYALDAGLTVTNDALFREPDATVYANVLVTDAARTRDPRVLALARALTSAPIRTFIESRYQGAVVPVS